MAFGAHELVFETFLLVTSPRYQQFDPVLVTSSIRTTTRSVHATQGPHADYSLGRLSRR